MNEGNTISENSTHLVGDGSVTNPRTVTVGKGRQIQNFTAQTVHHGLNTDGQISQRGVMLDKTTAIFNAIGKIDDGASGANAEQESRIDRKSTRLNSSHVAISYAVFCLKKKT